MKQKVFKIVVCMIMVLTCALAPVAASASNAAYILRVNADLTRMRQTAGNSAVVRKLPAGTCVLYGGENAGAYCKVYLTNGVSGYVYKEHLSGYGAVSKNKVYRTYTPADIYTRSGNSLKRRGTVPAGQFVLVYKTNGNWAFVKSVNGTSGYMKLNTMYKVF